MLPIPPEGYGAVEKHIHELGRALRARGHEVHVVSRVFGPASWNEYRFARWALVQTRRIRADVVHVHTTGVAATFAAARRPFVYTSHSRHWATARGLRERGGFALERFAARRARRLIALTPEVAQKMRAALGVDATVIPNGVDADAYRPDWAARQGGQALGVGMLAPHKMQDIAAEAAREAGWRLVLAGPSAGSGAHAAFEKRLKDLGAELQGPVAEKELRELYARSDAFLHLSTSEALSLAVLEAMASGLPLVASDVCVGQVVDGVTGFAIPSDRPRTERVKLAADALRRLRDDRTRRELGDSARRAALEKYTWAAVAEGAERVYASCTPAPTRGAPSSIRPADAARDGKVRSDRLEGRPR
jgi:glycosyltransferase involved in cell wall biosynthesis